MCMGKYVTAVFLLALLSGCVSNPISGDLRRQAQPLNYTQVAANPKTTAGTIVIWGGRIIDTVNSTNGGEIYVLQLPLNRRGRPANNDGLTQGRFIAFSRELLSPRTYPPGSLITVAGQLGGVRNERLQNVLFRYPLVEIKQTHLWANRAKTNNYYYYGANPDYPLWWDGGVGWYYPGGYESIQGQDNGGETRSGGGHR